MARDAVLSPSEFRFVMGAIALGVVLCCAAVAGFSFGSNVIPDHRPVDGAALQVQPVTAIQAAD